MTHCRRAIGVREESGGSRLLALGPVLAAGLAAVLAAGCRSSEAPDEREVVLPAPEIPPEITEEGDADPGVLDLPIPTARDLSPNMLLVDRTVRLAGRPELPGLPAVRSVERREASERALERFAAELADAANGDQWFERLVQIVRAPVGTRDELWCAGARTGRVLAWIYEDAFSRTSGRTYTTRTLPCPSPYAQPR